MENCGKWEHQTLINELREGMAIAKQLRVHLGSANYSETGDLLLQRILSSFEKALLILKWRGVKQTTIPVAPGVLESSISVNESPRSEEFDRGFKEQQEHKYVSKKRKVLPTWTDQVRICAENGLEGPNDDGYSWRKYGQKDILGAKYPRSYYRCTYRNIQDCWATKQVQRSDEDPTVFEITYKGKHTCSQVTNAVPPPASPEKEEMKQKNKNKNTQPVKSNEILLNLRTNLRVNIEDLDTKEIECPFSFPSTPFSCTTSENPMLPMSALVGDNLLGGYSPSFMSPATPESNYFSVSPFQMNGFGEFRMLQHSDSEIGEIISANTSATNSPMLDLDFSIEHADLDPNFPFDTPGFFT